MKGYGGPAQSSLTLGDAINGRYRYLELKCDECGHLDLTISGRPKEIGNRSASALDGAATLESAAIWAAAAKQSHDERQQRSEVSRRSAESRERIDSIS